MPVEFTLPSFAKINWTLQILGRRKDGYHELCTLFQTISLHDSLTFAESDRLTLTCDQPGIPTNEENLIIKAARALQEKKGIVKGASIYLEKRIPSPGGLGGGSSNAAVALIGMARLWEIEPHIENLQSIAGQLGSDVQFFLHGGTAMGTGRGEIIEQVGDIDEKFMLVVIPDVNVSTHQAFQRIDASNLTKDEPESILRVCRFMAESGDLRNKTLINDFEASVFPAEPEIARVKTRQAALKALEIESNWRKFAVATISRDKYREALHLAY
jgi:4-diphosphocytidyl-2-C-methyl-D-erythritol kinase